MAILDNIEVCIKSDGNLLAEYDDPDENTPRDTTTATKLIEATAGGKFSIEISVQRDYQFHEADYVRFDPCMDGRAETGTAIAKRRRADQTLAGRIDVAKWFDHTSGQWMGASFSFGRLEVLEHGDLPDDLDPQSTMQVGTIKLACYRVHRKPLRKPRACHKHPRATTVDQTSEKIMKGKAIENNIRLLDADALDETLLILFRYADERIVGQPAPRKCDYLAVKGHGKPLVFNFHYRSRNALQILGCIPRTESPARTIQDGEEAARKPVLATSDPDHTERERSQRAQEREKLQASHPSRPPSPQHSLTDISQAELAILDQLDRADRSLKPEPAQEGDLYEDLREPSPVSSRKREREHNAVQIKAEKSASGFRKRSRTSAPIETVDLTGD